MSADDAATLDAMQYAMYVAMTSGPYPGKSSEEIGLLVAGAALEAFYAHPPESILDLVRAVHADRCGDDGHGDGPFKWASDVCAAVHPAVRAAALGDQP